jgi:hypothetical protein
LFDPKGSDRVLRGGSWFFDGFRCRAAFRHGRAPTLRAYDLGFRLARTPRGPRRRDRTEPAALQFRQALSNIPTARIQEFSTNKPRTVIFTSGDDIEANKLVIELINSIGFLAIDLESLAKGGAMHEVGAPLSGLEPHLVRRLR